MSQRLDYINAAPVGYKALGGVYGYVSQCGLDPILIDFVFLRVSQINGCAYCIDTHTRDLQTRGVSTEKIVLVPVWYEAESLFTERERAALAWAETVTRVAETHIPDEAYAAAANVFDGKELADLTITIGLMNLFNRLAISFRKVPKAVEAASAG
ncbi:carboxymuconolactone decarboxylase family protein [Caballeronia sp. LZ043]|uniref:carboxymuconolactone decarboxylase family protein n=1 Tax=Caballeronia sp. LZ043 TaxID=3038569 RepID=UPI0028556422|nr:carboxymuconolactone decarboxylase family protein [Caballeronia sp. LZ043]MDR5823627.1 carboxymuconolactone decarboxylase family protein [Caballeronia sp. LZ043]